MKAGKGSQRSFDNLDCTYPGRSFPNHQTLQIQHDHRLCLNEDGTVAMQDIGDPAAARSRAILISAVLVLVLPFLTVALRCFCRIRIVAKGFGWDDASMVLAVVSRLLALWLLGSRS
jgi:hypothetical protein